MPALAAKKRPACSPAALTDQILRLREEINAFIQGKVAEVKGSKDGSSLHTDIIRSMLARGDDCHCRVALRLLEENNGR